MRDNLRMTVAEVATALNMDCNTVRVFIKEGVFPWGKCYKKPGNDKYTYLIFRKDFAEATGYEK